MTERSGGLIQCLIVLERGSFQTNLLLHTEQQAMQLSMQAQGQVCLASSDMLHMHLALAGTPFNHHYYHHYYC